MYGGPRRAACQLNASPAAHTHPSITGHIDQMDDDTDLSDIDRLARYYTGEPYPRRDRRRISAWIAVDGWHGWGALKDSSRSG